MADTSGKKRKRPSNVAATPSKKVAIDAIAPNTNIAVTHSTADGAGLILASTPGLTAPSIAFTPYSKPLSTRPATTQPKPTTHNVLLHSSQHPRLDYIAAPASSDQHLSHYVAVFNPASGNLRITPTHHVNLRCIPRSQTPADAQDGRRTFAQQREELGREFGTKKAKKMIASKTENAITNGEAATSKTQDVRSAILDAVADTTVNTPDKAKLEQDALAAKPIPKPNVAADKVEEVYAFNTLIPPHDARSLTVKDWQDKAHADEPITFSHRFPANRVNDLGKTDNVQRLKALKYLTFLLEWHDVLQSAGKAGKKVPKKEIISKKLAAWPTQLVDSVRRRFANESNELPKWHMDLLYTHMCALTLFIDGWTTDTSNLKDDLKMENKQIVQYFHELGCRTGPLTEKERETKKLNKAQAAVVRMARLRLPLEFPKPRAMRRK